MNERMACNFEYFKTVL